MSENEKLYGQLKEALLAIRKLKSEVSRLKSSSKRDIAVVGMSCRFPGGADDPESFWQLLSSGRDAIQVIPEERWPVDHFFDPDPDTPGKMYVREAGIISDISGFGNRFFGISGSEAQTMDPQQRILLECVWEAVESAAIPMHSLKESQTGVFIGITTPEYGRQNSITHPESINQYSATGLSASAAIGRISYQFGWQGPCVAIDTACSSSSVALHLASQSLNSGESNLAVAGGINLIVTPQVHIALSKVKALSPNARCRTFDQTADGYVRSEGCGILLLKRLDDAINDGDPILAVIKGSAVNQDGHSNGLTSPNALAQEKVIKSALKNAGVDPINIDYVETHGTGTPLGDPIELTSLHNVYNPNKNRLEKLKIGSVKTNIGHLEPAAGVAGAIKTILSLQKNEIPPHLHFQEPNQNVPWASMQLEVTSKTRSWKTGYKPRRAGLSSFGYAGTNTHIIFEEAPSRTVKNNNLEEDFLLMPLSAKSKTALKEVVNKCISFLHESDLPLEAILKSFSEGKDHFSHRICAMGLSKNDISDVLQHFFEDKRHNLLAHGKRETSDRNKVVFMCAGQGSQYKGMCRELYSRFPVFKLWIDKFEKIFHAESGVSLIEIMFGSASEDYTDQTNFTQPIIFAAGYSAAQLFQSWGIKPDAVTGHSIGEYVAAALCGLFSPEEGFKLVVQRGALMNAMKEPGGMLSVFLNEKDLAPYLSGLEDRISIAAINSANQTVISGELETMDILAEKLATSRVRTIPLKVSHAFHSPLMNGMTSDFEKILNNVAYAPMRIPFYSNLTGDKTRPTEPANADFWVNHVLQPVRFSDTLNNLIKDGYNTFIEMGAGSTLTSIGKRKEIENVNFIYTLDQQEKNVFSINRALSQLYVAGIEPNWKSIYAHIQYPRISLPTYPFERRKHWIPTKYELEPNSTLKDSMDWPLHALEWKAAQNDITNKDQVKYPELLLIVSHDEEIIEKIRLSADSLGMQVVWIFPKGRGEAGQDQYPIDYSNQAEWEELIKFYSDYEASFLFLLHCMDETNSDQEVCLGKLKSAMITYTILAQSIVRATSNSKLHVWTDRSQRIDNSELKLFGNSMWGLHQSFSLEHPGHAGALIDLDFSSIGMSAIEGLKQMHYPGNRRTIALRSRKIYTPIISQKTPDKKLNIQIRPESAYLITGGLGTLGISTVKWLINKGARTIYLNGRSKQPDHQQLEKLPKQSKERLEIKYLSGDVSNYESVENILKKIEQDGYELRGIIHAAGRNRPTPFMKLTTEDWDVVLPSKLWGSFNLHKATINQPLDFFFLYSSISAIWGSAQLSHYAAANCFLESLSAFRNQNGMSATCLNWAAWKDSNMIIDAGITEYLQKSGMILIEENEAFEVLSKALNSKQESWIVMNAKWESYISYLETNGKLSQFDKLRMKYITSLDEMENSDLLTSIRNAKVDDRSTRLMDHLKSMLTEVTGQYEFSDAHMNTGFYDLGLNSLKSIELKQNLEKDLAIKLQSTVFFDYPNLKKLFKHLSIEISKKHNIQFQSNGAKDEEISNLRNLLRSKLST